ncbi:hypothetical protein ACC870_38770, partial [Rhizobium ruizarguesonis]
LMTTPSIVIIPYLLRSWFGYDLNIVQSAVAAFTVTVIMDIWLLPAPSICACSNGYDGSETSAAISERVTSGVQCQMS